MKNKILMLLMFSIFLISIVSATIVTDILGQSSSSSSNVNDYRGVKMEINGNNNVYLIRANTMDLTNGNNWYLYNGSGTNISSQLGTGTITSHVTSDINYTLLAGQTYYLLVGGTNYENGYNNTALAFPYTKTGYNVTSSYGNWQEVTNTISSYYSITANATINIPPAPSINTTLISPFNNEVLTISSKNFTSYYNMSGTNLSYQWKNTTYSIWYANGTLINSSTIILTENQSIGTLQFNNLVLGNYLYNAYAYYSNDTFVNSTWASPVNYSFLVGASLNSLTYNNKTYETSSENFVANFSILSGSSISLAQLIYNGTTYTITNLTQTTDSIILQKRIDIPVNIYPIGNQTNNFTIRFTYGGGTIQDTNFSQNVSFIRFQQCNSTFHTQTLNFTYINEVNQTKIVGTDNPTNLEVSFKYWVGEGTTYKNFSYQNLSSPYSNYSFCMYPYAPNNYTFKTEMDMLFSATSFRENNYHLRNATLTNISSDIALYLIHTDYANKFFLTFLKGTGIINDATITVQKYFTGLGSYQTVGILLSDAEGETTMWQEIDKTYKYSIVKNGTLLGTVERVSPCAATPCSLTIQISESMPDIFADYYDYYATNVASNLSYNKSSKIVTYDFIDLTGLAHYFNLVVRQSRLNDSGFVVCNTTSYSTAGTLSCNLTGYTGDFTATGYISRSPTKVDKILGILIDESAIGNLGSDGILLIMGIIITIIFSAAIISKGSPTTVLFFLGLTILGLKLGGLFPFSWIVVVTVEVLILFFISKIKT